jgi:hypothetical protein
MVPPDTMMTYYCGIETINNLGYGHSGEKQRYCSRMAYDPASDFAVVAFTNGNNLLNGMISFGELVNGVVLESCYKAKLIVRWGEHENYPAIHLPVHTFAAN